MKKFFTLLMALVAVMAVNASVVTFNFTNPTALGITAPNSGAGTNITDPVVVEGVTMTVTNGSTPTRIWNSNGNYDFRIYRNGTITFSASEMITAVEFSGSSISFNELTSMAWAGTPTTSVTFTASATCKISTITLTIGESAVVWVPDTIGVADANALIAAGDTHDHYVYGVVKGAPFNAYTSGFSGVVSFWMSDVMSPNDTIEFYQGKAANNVNWSSLEQAQETLHMGDTVLVYAGSLTFYSAKSIDEITGGHYVATFGVKPTEEEIAPITYRVYDFANIWESRINVDANGEKSSYTSGDVTIPSVNYTTTEGEYMNVTISGMDHFSMQYKNSNTKNNILKFANNYMQADGKNVILTFTDVTIGDSISLLVSAKGSTNATFTAYSGATGNDQDVPRMEYLEDYMIVSFIATSDTVRIRETTGGFRIRQAVVGDVAGYTIQSEDESKGTVEIIDFTPEYGILSFSATAQYGYHFAQWSDGNTENPRTIVLTQDTIITALFAPNVYSVALTCDSTKGSVEGPQGGFEYGTELTYTATPKYGYHFAYWSDGNYSNPCSYIVTKDDSIEAIFAPNQYSLSALTNPNGSVVGTGSFDYLAECTFEAVPNYGYHFAQWNDGNTENPRTIVLTQDTVFSAEYAVDLSGKCGDDLALTWEYDAQGKTLTISGAGKLNSNYTFGVEAPTAVEKLVIAEGVTEIGNSAFSSYMTLRHLSVAASVKKIYDQAFYNCEGLEEIYCYRVTPPTAYSNTFDGVEKFECLLYVLSSSIDMYKAATGWRDFYYVYAIDAEDVTEPITDVTVDPTDNEVVVTWPTSNDAATYSLQITKDGVVFCTLTFNANGQLTGIAFAPGRNGEHNAPAAIKTSNGGLRFTVTGLSSATDYHLAINAKNANDQVVASYSADFTTTGETTAIEDINVGDDQSVKILRNGQIYILRGEKVYTLEGQEMK